MKLYNRAGAFQRFLAFLIDIFIIMAFSIGLGSIILAIAGFSFSSFIDSQFEYLYDMLFYAVYQDEAYMESANLALAEYNNYLIIFSIVIDALALVATVLYLIVLPKYWSKQTVGRLATKTIVINHKGNVSPSISQIIVREVVGTWFIYIVLINLVGGLPIIVSAFIAMISGRSLVDRISGTDIVQNVPLIVDEKAFTQGNNPSDFDYDESSRFKPNKDEFYKNDAIDAEVKDINNNNDVDNNDESSDEEYKVF